MNLKSEEINSMSQGAINKLFINLCANGEVENIKYLLTSPELTKHADIHTDSDYSFQLACRHGNLELVRYLATSSELKEHSDIFAANNVSFQYACSSGYLDIVKYLLTSTELEKNVDIHCANDDGFKLACINGMTNILKYFIFDMNICKTKKIKNILENYPNGDASYFFSIRELNEKLTEELNSDKHKIKKNKL